MQQLGQKMRVRVEVQDDYDIEGSSNIPEIVAEETKKIGNGEWTPYGIIIEYLDRSEKWQPAASVWGFVTASGLDGVYDEPADIDSDYLKESAEDVRSEALEDDGLKSMLVTWPLGIRLPDEAYNATPSVIGRLEKSHAGNTVIRVGRKLRPTRGSGWTQTEHVVLTPAERERLIAELIAQRSADYPV